MFIHKIKKFAVLGIVGVWFILQTVMNVVNLNSIKKSLFTIKLEFFRNILTKQINRLIF